MCVGGLGSEVSVRNEEDCSHVLTGALMAPVHPIMSLMEGVVVMCTLMKRVFLACADGA